MRKSLKILSGVCAFGLVTAATFAGTFAYLTRTAEVTNSIFVGETRTDTPEDFPEPPNPVEPGDVFTKKPWAENVGNLDMFVRCRVDFSNNEAGMPNNQGGFCFLNYNTEYWTYNSEDGYWYYKHILHPGETTENTALFDTVKISEGIEARDLDNFDIIVYTEAEESGDHPESDYMSTEIWGDHD